MHVSTGRAEELLRAIGSPSLKAPWRGLPPMAPPKIDDDVCVVLGVY